MESSIFRLLCPAEKTGKVIGKSGCIISNIRSETCSKIRIDDPVPGYDERVIVISADPNNSNSNPYLALVRVLDRIEGFGEERKEATCRMLVNANQVGLILERVRSANSGVNVKAFGKEYLPASAEGEDEILHITGSLSDVKNALITVSGCLQDFHKTEAMKFSNTKPFVSTFRGSESMKFTNSKPFVSNLHGSLHSGHMDSSYVQRSYLTNRRATDFRSRNYSADPTCKNIIEKEVTFRILCSNDRVGSLIGKSGTTIRALQIETGASIRVVDALCDSDERIIIISCPENIEMKGSNAQDAVLRVHSRIAEGFEKGSHVLARLLVNAQLVGCLLGKGGYIISEMRRSTGADIRIFSKEQVPKYDGENDEVVQVSGSFELVQEALFNITSRIREAIFFHKPYASSSMSQHSSDNPPKRSRIDMNAGQSRTSDSSDRVPITYKGEDIGYYSTELFSLLSGPQDSVDGNTRGSLNTGANHCSSGSVPQTPVVTSKTVELVLPREVLGYVRGEDDSHLTMINEISGAEAAICDPKPGEAEGKITISGNPVQIHIAETLVQGFIFRGKYSQVPTP